MTEGLPLLWKVVYGFDGGWKSFLLLKMKDSFTWASGDCCVYVCPERGDTQTPPSIFLQQRRSEGSASLTHVGIEDEARTEVFLSSQPSSFAYLISVLSF